MSEPAAILQAEEVARDGATVAAHGLIVALLGAESTGKTTLAGALAQAQRCQGRHVCIVAEYLREFCDREGRTPRVDEQTAIAAEQWHRIEQAAASEPGVIVLADTTPLMTAVYSELVFGDRSLYAQALALQRRCAATLLMGLDLPWRADGLQRDGSHVQGPVDGLIRAALHAAGLPYAAIYGEGAARTTAALAALAPVLSLPRTAAP